MCTYPQARLMFNSPTTLLPTRLIPHSLETALSDTCRQWKCLPEWNSALTVLTKPIELRFESFENMIWSRTVPTLALNRKYRHLQSVHGAGAIEGRLYPFHLAHIHVYKATFRCLLSKCVNPIIFRCVNNLQTRETWQLAILYFLDTRSQRFGTFVFKQERSEAVSTSQRSLLPAIRVAKRWCCDWLCSYDACVLKTSPLPFGLLKSKYKPICSTSPVKAKVKQ